MWNQDPFPSREADTYMGTVVGIYCIAIGVLIAAMWAHALAHGAWQRADSSHAEMALHLVAEYAAAAWLVVAGAVFLFVGRAATPFLAAGIGMLLYTAVVSPGYFLGRREWAPVVMFAAIIALTITAAVVLLAAL